MLRDFRSRSSWLAVAGLLLSSGAHNAPAQERRTNRIDVEQYTIDAEITPGNSTLAARAAVRFSPIDDNITSATFELNNALMTSRVVDEQGNQIPTTRNQTDSTIRLTFPQPLPKGKPVTITFEYDGRLTGNEESPVYGIKFAAIHPDFSYLMYPARWFPVNGYTVDRFGFDMKITVPPGYKALGSGIDSNEPSSDGMTTTRFKFSQPSFPGSIAVVRNDSPNTITSSGVATTLCFRESAPMAGAYGQE